MSDEKIPKTVRLPERDYQAVEKYAEQNGLSEADAFRELIRDRLRATGYYDDAFTTRGHVARLPPVILNGLILALVAANFTALWLL